MHCCVAAAAAEQLHPGREGQNLQNCQNIVLKQLQTVPAPSTHSQQVYNPTIYKPWRTQSSTMYTSLKGCCLRHVPVYRHPLMLEYIVLDCVLQHMPPDRHVPQTAAGACGVCESHFRFGARKRRVTQQVTQPISYACLTSLPKRQKSAVPCS